MFADLPPKRILLIEPPYFTLFGYARWHYPITTTFVATYLQELGHFTRLLDADRPTEECREYNRSEAGDNYYKYGLALKNQDHPIWIKIKQTLTDFHPDIVCIAASISAKADSADLIAKMVREIYGSKVWIVLGGVHVSAMRSMYPDYEFGDQYDEVVQEIPKLIDRKPDKKLIIDYNKYEPHRFTSIMTSSGCPNSCTFCCYSLKKEKMVFRNLESIEVELMEIKEQLGTKFPIYFVDDNFLTHTKRFFEITGITRKLGLRFKAGGRIMDLRKEKVEAFKENGGEKIYVGIESGSQRILDLINKRLKIEKVIERTRWLYEAGLEWAAFFIVGFPFETSDDLKRTKELIEIIKPSFVSLNRFTPYPGTKIYQDYFYDGNISFKDLFQMNYKKPAYANDKLQKHIEDMFHWVDEYNAANQQKRSPVNL